MNKHLVEVTTRLTRMASDALSWNIGLFWVFPSLTIGLVVNYEPIIVFMVVMKFNGKIACVRTKKASYFSFPLSPQSLIPSQIVETLLHPNSQSNLILNLLILPLFFFSNSTTLNTFPNIRKLTLIWEKMVSTKTHNHHLDSVSIH